jgi:aryl-alcohol dehydrogenase-like predicted oxidoreductase
VQKQMLGETRLSMTRMGLGLAALGRPGYINLGHAHDLSADYAVDAMQSHANTVLDTAWTAGIRYFDAARSYGRAEEFLANWLTSRDINPADMVVGSKWGYTYKAEWQIEADAHEVKEHSLAVLQRQISESLALLGEQLNLYQIHSATFESGVLDNVDVLAALARLKSDGIAIGLTLSGANQADVLRRALAVQVDGARLFESVQATWNLLEPSAGVALAEASEAGMGVIVKEALANGRLTPRNTRSAFAAKLALLQSQADRLHTTVDALSLASVLAQPWVDVVLSGAASVEHLQANVAAFAVQLDDEASDALASLAEEPKGYWQTRGELAWN